MKVVILAGGRGTRLQDAASPVPKPMVEIGGRPILWHIMEHFANYGHTEFGLALGYKSEVIKRYFLDRLYLSNDFTINLANGERVVESAPVAPWSVHLQYTGEDTQTGGRIKRMRRWLAGEPLLLTYGDGVSDVNLDELVACHRKAGRLATVTAVRPPARFGGLQIDGDRVTAFTEKPQTGEGWINGGFFVLEPAVLDYIRGDDDPFEREPLERIAADGQLSAFEHNGFWQCMDTPRDLHLLQELFASDRSPLARIRAAAGNRT